MHLRLLNLTLIRQSSKRDEWEGVCSAQEDVRMSKCPRRPPLSQPTPIYRDTPSNRAVGQNSRAPNAPTHRHQTHLAVSVAPDLTTCLAHSKFNDRFSEHRTRLTPSTQRPTPCVRCTPVSIQRQFSLTGRVRRWVNGRHYVRCTRRFKEAADVT
jgi:hypothetical protein